MAIVMKIVSQDSPGDPSLVPGLVMFEVLCLGEWMLKMSLSEPVTAASLAQGLRNLSEAVEAEACKSSSSAPRGS